MTEVVFSLIRSSGVWLPLSLLASILGGWSGAWLIGLLNQAVQAPTAELPELGLRFAAVGASTVGMRWAAELGFLRFQHSCLATLRRSLSAAIGELPYREREANGQSRLLPLLTQDLAGLGRLLEALPAILIQGATVLGCLGYLAWLSWKAFIAAAVIVLAGTLGQRMAGRRASVHLRRGRDEQERMLNLIQSLVAGAKELKLHAQRRQTFIEDRLAPSIEAVRRAQARGLSVHAGALTWGSFLFFVAIGSVVFGAGALLERDVPSAYALVFLYMMHPIEQLMESLPQITRGKLALEKITSAAAEFGGPLLEAIPFGRRPRPAEVADPIPVQPGGANLHVQLQAVQHAYHKDTEDGTFRLGPIDLSLSPGQLVFLVGGNGSGKTTLAKLLVGLYEPEAGVIRLNGRHFGSSDREAQRQHFSAVFSDYHLFDSLLGVEAPDLDQKARELLVALDLDNKVRICDGQLSTTALSSGQRKRLALIVAWLEDRPAYVFDEWAADQDPEYKQVFYEWVLPELKARNKTVLVITHDDRYFHRADRCLRLDDGRLARLDAVREFEIP